MEIAATLILFIIYSIHIFFIDKNQIEKIDIYINTSKYPWILLSLLGIMFLGYIGLWVVLSMQFIIFMRGFYEFSKYELLIDSAFFILLSFLVWRILTFEIRKRYE